MSVKEPALQVVRNVTRSVDAHVPSYTLRHAWYRRVVGMEIRDAPR